MALAVLIVNENYTFVFLRDKKTSPVNKTIHPKLSWLFTVSANTSFAL